MEMEQRRQNGQNVYDGNPLVNDDNTGPGKLCEWIYVYTLSY